MASSSLISIASKKTTLAAFNGATYGFEYLSFVADELIVELQPPTEAMGWSYGILMTTMVVGWFPPSYVI